MASNNDRKIVMKSFKNIKDDKPNIIDIDCHTGKVSQISTDHDVRNFKSIKKQTFLNMMNTFMPNGYPYTVAENYLKFVAVSNIGAISFTAMGFLST